jgi:mannose-1-phosphate guanylyltransferase
MAEKKAALWGIVLAGGEGNRLKRCIQEYFGTDAPKQFCAFVGRRTMIEQALRRAERIIPRKRLYSRANLFRRCIAMTIQARKPTSIRG